mmetsp:Transcript_12389/g.24981  ORF Transcript_12389/g.24981 Transcript_12389/m.24981 type:complete len:301 (-) Transcript_12389:394-1296(-)
MPAVKATISSVKIAMDSFAEAIAASKSETLRSNSFFLSSLVSRVFSQYSFFESSSACSCFKVATMPSIMARTFSKPIFLPRRARKMASSFGRLDGNSVFKLAARAARALARKLAAPTWTCMKLALALGNVALKSSRASSSLSTLIVSAKATSSSARNLLRSSHSFAFLSQSSFKLDENCLSASSASLVSPKSFFICAMDTPSSPILAVLVSMASDRKAFSFFLAAMSSSNERMAASSASDASLRLPPISSCNSLRIPTICPLCGEYSESDLLDRKARMVWRSSSLMSRLSEVSLRRTSAE